MMRFSWQYKTAMLVIMFIVILASLLAVLLWDMPVLFRLTQEEEDRRVFSIGTLENITAEDFRILSVWLVFDDVNENQANVQIDLTVEKKKAGAFEATFIIILPFDAEVYYPSTIDIQNKTYGRIVYLPFLIEDGTVFETRSLHFVWPSFSKRISLHKWSFNIEARAFHYLFDNEGEPFYSLVPSSFLSNEDWIPLRIKVDTKDRAYSFTDFHPSSEENFEYSVKWSEITPIFSSHVTGTYEDKQARFIYDTTWKVFLFIAGALSSLIIREIYRIVKERA